MTPYEFYTLYRNLNVRLSTGMYVYGVDVHEYRNATDYFAPASWAAKWNKAHPDDKVKADDYWLTHKRHNADHDVADGMTKGWGPLIKEIKSNAVANVGKTGRVVRVQQGWRKSGRVEGTFSGDVTSPVFYTEQVDDYLELMRVYDGKGSPQAIEQALRLTELFGLFGAAGSIEGSMRAHVEECVGLDCNGFVGNYLKACKVPGQGPENPPITFAPPAARLSRIEDVKARNTLVWPSGDGSASHVAIIDKVESITTDEKGRTKALVWVCESCGSSTRSGANALHSDGLNYTQYVVSAVDKTRRFTVSRAKGWDRPSGGMTVYISRVTSET